MMNQANAEIRGYAKTAIQFSLFLFATLLIVWINAYFLDWHQLQTHVVGTALGAAVAIVNLFALGLAFYGLVIKKTARWIIFVPMATFTAMCAAAFIIAFYAVDYVVGFAIGLTVPVLVGAVIIYGSSRLT